MQGWYAAQFDREMGCTEADLRAWIPSAVAGREHRMSENRAVVDIDRGCLRMRWQVLPERRIALIRLPRLAVRFEFEDVEDESRQAFMRHFDLSTQRGGG